MRLSGLLRLLGHHRGWHWATGAGLRAELLSSWPVEAPSGQICFGAPPVEPDAPERTPPLRRPGGS